MAVICHECTRRLSPLSLQELSERTEQQQNPCPVTLGDTRRSQNALDCSEFHILELFLGNGASYSL